MHQLGRTWRGRHAGATLRELGASGRWYALALAFLFFLGGCRRIFPAPKRDAGPPPVSTYDAGPRFPQNALPQLPPGTRVTRSKGNDGYVGIVADDRFVYWATNRDFRWMPLLTGVPPVGISVADPGLANVRVLAEPRRIQGHIIQNAEFLYALQEYRNRDCEYGVCKIPPSTEVYRISKSTGASARIATVPDWVEASLWTGGRLLLAGAMSGKLWALDATNAPTVVADGLPARVIDLAEVHSTLFILTDADGIYGGTPRRSLTSRPLPISPGDAVTLREIPRAYPFDWIRGGERLYAGVKYDRGRIVRLSADGVVEGELRPACPNTENSHFLQGMATSANTVFWFCSAQGEGYIAANDALTWSSSSTPDAGDEP